MQVHIKGGSKRQKQLVRSMVKFCQKKLMPKMTNIEINLKLRNFGKDESLGYAIPSMTLGPAKGYETGGKYNKYNNNQPTTIMEGNTYHHHNHASYNNEKMIISLERIIRCLSNLSEEYLNFY